MARHLSKHNSEHRSKRLQVKSCVNGAKLKVSEFEEWPLKFDEEKVKTQESKTGLPQGYNSSNSVNYCWQPQIYKSGVSLYHKINCN
jgi:hypothetical protein